MMHGGMEFMRSAVVRCAVEWYEAGMELEAKRRSGNLDGYEVSQRKTWDATLALAHAVKAWKEAQA